LKVITFEGREVEADIEPGAKFSYMVIGFLDLAGQWDASLGALTSAGVLVGFGTRLGNGCTSGHGVCGVARLSARSIAATATFVTAGAAVVYVVNHLLRGSL
jgi:hypothetical protein